MRQISADHDGQAVAVVSHGGAILRALKTILRDSPEKIGAVTIGVNTSITELESENGEFRIVSLNDSTHLDTRMEKLLGRPYRKRTVEANLWYHAPQQSEQERWLRSALKLEDSEACPAYAEEDVLIGCRGEDDADKVGIVVMLPEQESDTGRGWIDVLWIKPALRRRGFGVQLLGQAVYRCRAMGCEFLRIAVSRENAAVMEFLHHNGFVSVGMRASDESVVLEKDIAIRPLER